MTRVFDADSNKYEVLLPPFQLDSSNSFSSCFLARGEMYDEKYGVEVINCELVTGITPLGPFPPGVNNIDDE